MTLRHIVTTGFLAAGLAASAQAQQGVSLASGFTDYTQWTLLGSATAANLAPGNGFSYSLLTLTQLGIGDQAGAGYAPQALVLDFNAPIHFDFHFFLLNPNEELRGDGLTFTLAANPGLGNAGSGLGYENLLGPSVAFAIDTFHFDGEPVSPSLQILQDGNVSPVAYTETGLGDAIRNAEYQWLASVDWQPAGLGDNTGTLSGSLSNLKLGSFSVQAPLDLSGLAGAPVFYGFTASNGAATDGHLVSSAVAVPEPGGWALMLAGMLAGAALTKRRLLRRD